MSKIPSESKAAEVGSADRCVPPGDVRSRLDEILDKAAENMADVTDEEFDRAVEEAMQHERNRPV